jgi:hypothetical protein
MLEKREAGAVGIIVMVREINVKRNMVLGSRDSPHRRRSRKSDSA